MKNNIVTVPYEKSIGFITFLMNQNLFFDFDFKKNYIRLYNNEHEKILQYNFPLITNLSENVIKDKSLFNNSRFVVPDFAIMLIQTGNAALGYYKKGELVQHKVIRKYMTRQKQGKSQLKYLKTKGKSRAGSRVRLANAVHFFEEINERMIDWFDAKESPTIIYSCTPMLWGHLFQSKIKPPFDKKHSWLKKLPLDTGIPTFEILQKAGRYSQLGHLEKDLSCPIDLSQKLEKFIHSPGI